MEAASSPSAIDELHVPYGAANYDLKDLVQASQPIFLTCANDFRFWQHRWHGLLQRSPLRLRLSRAGQRLWGGYSRS